MKKQDLQPNSKEAVLQIPVFQNTRIPDLIQIVIEMNRIIIGMALAFLTGCGVNYSIPSEDHNTAKKPAAIQQLENQNLLVFKVNGREVRTTVWSITRFVWKNDFVRILLNITSNMHEDKRAIDVNLSGAAPALYPLGEPLPGEKKSYGSYYPDYLDDQSNCYAFTSGAFELTEVDTVQNRVNACFYGKVKNTRGDSLEITEGRIINGFLKVDITNY